MFPLFADAERGASQVRPPSLQAWWKAVRKRDAPTLRGIRGDVIDGERRRGSADDCGPGLSLVTPDASYATGGHPFEDRRSWKHIGTRSSIG